MILCCIFDKTCYLFDIFNSNDDVHFCCHIPCKFTSVSCEIHNTHTDGTMMNKCYILESGNTLNLLNSDSGLFFCRHFLSLCRYSFTGEVLPRACIMKSCNWQSIVTVIPLPIYDDITKSSWNIGLICYHIIPLNNGGNSVKVYFY